jgi:ABC-type multidrug transport system fused ATPase/permease subunit
MSDGQHSAANVGLRTLLPYLRGQGGTLALVALLSLLASAATLSQPLLARSALDRVAAQADLRWPISLLVVAMIGTAALSGVRDFLLHRVGEGLVLTTRRRLAGHLLRLPIVEYDRRRTGDLLSRVGTDTTLLRVVVTSGLFTFGTGMVMVVGAAVAMVLIDAVLFGLTVAGLATGLCLTVLLARRLRGLSREAQERVGYMTSTVERALAAVRTIRANRAETREAEIVGDSAVAAYRAGIRVGRWQAVVSPVSATAMQAVFLLVLGVGGGRIASGAISIGSLVAFVLFLFYLMLPLSQVIQAYTQVQSGLAALERIEQVLRLPPEHATSVRERHRAVPRQHAEIAVEFRRVGFAYDADPVLRDVSFTVPTGTRTAVVGPSGAGKSTLLALVERFYDVTSGSILVGGVDLRRQSPVQLRGRLGYVEQEAPVLAGTIRQNLLLASPDATTDQLLAVLDRVNLRHLLYRSPDGLDAEVGERGVLLSGGERQRLAIARTLLADHPILLLDEPTSHLDARNEATLREVISSAAGGRTLIVVAHRLSTVVDADQIVVLDRGSVAAVGSHRELTERSDLYRELAAHQLLLR